MTLSQKFHSGGIEIQESYIDRLNGLLKPRPNGAGRVLDLFAGCGGLALGFEAQGFETIGYEMDPDCCETYALNHTGKCHRVFLTPETALPEADIVIGGPPCQPFSVVGNQRGSQDVRNGFPAFVSAIDRVRPRMWLFENVRGVSYRNKAYFDQVVEELRSLRYRVTKKLLNASEYGIPQNRERMFVVGCLSEGFSFPPASRARVTVGQALGSSVKTTPPESKFLTRSQDAYIARYEAASKCTRPRDLHLNEPARTLTCRNLAAATSDMQRVRLPDGRRRRLLVREAARLQSFPDWFQFKGNEESAFYQIGNAVPPLLAFQLAGSVKEALQVCSKNSQVSPIKPERARLKQLVMV